MSQLLRIPSYRHVLQTPALINHSMCGLAVDLLTCRACQRLQQRSYPAFLRGRVPVRESSTNTHAAQEQFQRWKRNRWEEEGVKKQLVKVLEARLGQLQKNEKRIHIGEAGKAQLSGKTVSAPSAGKVEQLPPSWQESLANFNAQMNERRPGHQKTEIEDKNLANVNSKEYINKGSTTQHKVKTADRDKNVLLGDVSSSVHKNMANTGQKRKKVHQKVSEVKAKKATQSQTSVGKSHNVVSSADQCVLLSQGGVPVAIDYSDEIDVEVESEADMVTEIERVLQENYTESKMTKKLESYLNKLVREQKAQLGGNPATFWKPEELRDMAEVKQGLEVIEKLMHKMGQLRQRAVDRELAKQTTRRSAQQTAELIAYIEACLHTDKVRRAHSALAIRETNRKSRYRSRSDAHQYTITDPEIYNRVMAAWAKQGKLEPIRRLFVQMKDTNLQPNLQSYASCLECLGRQTPPATDTISRIIAEIETAGFDVQDMLTECTFHDDQWMHVLKAITTVQPDYTPNLPPTVDQYTCHLLADLNDKHSHQVSSQEFKEGLLSHDELIEQAQEQLKCEQQDFITVPTILPKNVTDSRIREARKRLEQSKQQWRRNLRKAFMRDLGAEESKSKGSTAMSIVPFLKLFPPETFVNLMMQEVDSVALETENYSPSISLLQRHFGYRIHHHYLVKNRMKTNYVFKMMKVYNEYLRCYASPGWQDGNHRQCWQSLLTRHSDGSHWAAHPESWNPQLAKMVGKWLYKIILMDVKIDANIFKWTKERSEIPAFYTVYRQVGPQVQEVIKPHPLLVRLYRSANIEELTFDARVMPSLSPPLPWHGVHSGGNLLSTTSLIVNPGRSQDQIDVLRQLPRNQINPVYDSINALSATPWRINKQILDLVIDVFNHGGDADLDVPKPASSCPSPPKIVPNMTDAEKVAVLRERQKMKKLQQEMHGLWMTELYRLSIANMYRDKVFWFPHNLDFRSRTYATPPHFNHLGSDLARSLLTFAEGRPLGPDGLTWLKIHLINLTGFMKRSSNLERLEYANEIMPHILDSADNSMRGDCWWQSSDEPWQTLACCKEVANAVRSPNPANYICYFPVHQDGSCNGLQHYAALGRDQSGAESVNLSPFTRPKDVYSDVVELVEKERQKDAADGKEIAIALEGFIRRKVIKQTIMTTVYGVTQFGARLQIERQLEAIEDFPSKLIFEASLYLTQKTFLCLQQMFTSTKEIQDWLTVCAKIISSVFYRPVEWTTPVGWPVIQPYYRPYNPTGGSTGSGPIEIPSTRRQKNGFPPNFIHSLDSTHMMLTAIHCHLVDVTFVSVHDCYWTHPSEVNIMNKICRDQFVALHSQPILEDLAHFMLTKFGFQPTDEDYHVVDPITRDFINHVLNRVPERGTFDLENVKDSTYFFS